MGKDLAAADSQATLYIWPSGDGFAFQSMSAECLAAIAYFQLVQISNNPARIRIETEWDATKSPDGQLPYLRCACGTRLGSNIILYWNHFSECQTMKDYNLDSWMHEDVRADDFA
jgi:outer membrane transport complex protein